MTLRKGLPAKLAATDANDTRYDFNNLVVCNADGSPRGGVTAPLTALVSSSATMNVAVAAFSAVAVRDGGVVLLDNDGPVNVLLTSAPAANSRIDVIYAKQNDASSTVTTPDANNTPIIDKVTGTASSSPTKPAIPTGAVELATVLVPSTATATNSAGVVISQTAQFTAGAGGVVTFPTLTGLQLWTTARDGQLAFAVDTDNLWEYLATAVTPGWYHVGGKPVVGAFSYTGIYSAGSPAPRLLSGNGWNSLDGIVSSTTASYVAGTTYALGSIPANMAPSTTQVFNCVSNISAVAWLVISSTGTVTMVLSLSFTGQLNLSLTNCMWRTKGLV